MVYFITFDAEGRYPVNELRIEQDGTGKRKETTTRFGPEGVKVEKVSTEAGPDGAKVTTTHYQNGIRAREIEMQAGPDGAKTLTATEFDKTGETPLKRSIEETGADGRPLKKTVEEYKDGEKIKETVWGDGKTVVKKYQDGELTSESTHTLLGSILDSAWKSAAAQAMWQSIKLGWQYFVEGEEIKPEQLWETGISIGMAALFGGAAGGWSYGAGTALTWWQKLRIGGSTSGLQSVSTEYATGKPISPWTTLLSALAGGGLNQTANLGTAWEIANYIGGQTPWDVVVDWWLKSDEISNPVTDENPIPDPQMPVDKPASETDSHTIYLPFLTNGVPAVEDKPEQEVEPSTSESTPESHTIYLPILINGVPAVEDEPEQEMEQIRQEIEKMQEEMNLLQEQMDKLAQQQQREEQIRQVEEKYREEMEQLRQQNQISFQQTDVMYRKRIGDE